MFYKKNKKYYFAKKWGCMAPLAPQVSTALYTYYIYIYVCYIYFICIIYIYIYVCIYFTFYIYYRCTQGEDTCFIGRSDREKGWNEMRRGDCNPLCNMLPVRPFTRSASSNALFNDLVSENKQINRLGEN